MPSTLAALGVLFFFDNDVARSFEADGGQLLTALIPATFIFLLGVYDDLWTANARLKFAGQALAAALLYLLGGRIEAVSAPLVLE